MYENCNFDEFDRKYCTAITYNNLGNIELGDLNVLLGVLVFTYTHDMILELLL